MAIRFLLCYIVYKKIYVRNRVGHMKEKALRIGLSIAAVLLLWVGCLALPDTQKHTESDRAQTNQAVTAVSEDDTENNSSVMSVHFIDVGQGDCTLIICDGEAMLIDAGNTYMGTAVQLYLTKQNVDCLKYVIGTHPDSDHIGGLDVILYKFDCETVIMPDKGNDTAAYRDVIDVMTQKGYVNTLPSVGDSYTLGSAAFTILSPSVEYEESNDNSVALLLKHGENTFLFTGDAEDAAEKDILNCGISVDADVYKAGHHGSETSSSAVFLDTVTPEYAVISCGQDNSYGHPHAETLNRLQSAGAKIFRTDVQGNIIVFSDGTKLTWNCVPYDIWQEEAQTPDSQAPEITYILNTNTMKFHVPGCSSVNDMADRNKLESTDSREAVISQGYVPCKRCNP